MTVVKCNGTFSMMPHHILPDKCEVGGILTEMRSVRRYLRSRQLLTHPFWLTSRSLTSSQPMKQLFVTSSTSSYRYVRPESVDLCFHHGLTCMEYRGLRRQARRLERLYRRTKLPVDRSTWVRFVRDMHRRYRDKERSCWEAKITSNAKDSKRLWATIDAISLVGAGLTHSICSIIFS